MSPEFGYNQEKKYEPPVKVSAFTEIMSVAPEKLIRNVEDLAGKVVWLSDGSSSVANCRAVELATTLIAAHNLHGIVEGIVTDTVGGGHAELALNDLGIDITRLELNTEIVDELKAIFPRVIFDEKVMRFLSAESFVFPESKRSLREANLRSREALIRGAAREINITLPNIAVLGCEDLPHFKDVSVQEFLNQNSQSPDQMVLKFCCPDCSRMQQTAVEHGVLPTGQVVKHHQFPVKCKGGKDLAQAFTDGKIQEKSLSEMVKLGFFVSGKAIYRLTTKSLDPETDVLLVRNYSNSRGTIAQIVSECNAPIGITQRFYFDDKKDIPGKDFIQVLRGNTALQNAIKSQPLLITNRDIDIFLPC